MRKTTFQWSKVVSEAIFPTIYVYICIFLLKSGLRFSFGALEVPKPSHFHLLTYSLGPNGPILQIFLVVQYSLGSLKIPLDGSNNLIFLDLSSLL